MQSTRTKRSVNVTRLIYLLVCEFVGAMIAKNELEPQYIWVGISIGLLIAAFFIFVESLMKPFSLRELSTATFGLGIGVFCAFLLSKTGFFSLIEIIFRDQVSSMSSLMMAVSVTLYSSLGFLGAVLALRSSRNDFAFIIPYVQFRKETSPGPPIVLDADAILDSRLTGIITSKFIEGDIIIPRYVLDELQVMANSPTPARRQTGRRGLESLEELQRSNLIPISIHDSEGMNPEETMDAKLVHTCRLLSARLLTTDDNLTKAARLNKTSVLNINELTQALKPRIAVGERIQLALVRTGKDEHQAVGYLPDGSMIVVNHAVDKIGSTQDVTVISTLQTEGGLLVFAELYKREA